MYKYTRVTYTQNPPSFGGNWECGAEYRTWFSPSPKLACAREGSKFARFTGVDGCPIMEREILTAPNGRVIFDRWLD